MRFAFGVEAYREFPFEHALQRLSEFGYAGIDLPVDRPFAFPPDYDAARRRDLRRLCERYRLMVANLATSTVAALGLGRYPWAPLGHRRCVAARSVRRLPERRTLHIRP